MLNKDSIQDLTNAQIFSDVPSEESEDNIAVPAPILSASQPLALSGIDNGQKPEPISLEDTKPNNEDSDDSIEFSGLASIINGDELKNSNNNDIVTEANANVDSNPNPTTIQSEDQVGSSLSSTANQSPDANQSNNVQAASAGATTTVPTNPINKANDENPDNDEDSKSRENATTVQSENNDLKSDVSNADEVNQESSQITKNTGFKKLIPQFRFSKSRAAVALIIVASVLINALTLPMYMSIGLIAAALIFEFCALTLIFNSLSNTLNQTKYKNLLWKNKEKDLDVSNEITFGVIDHILPFNWVMVLDEKQTQKNIQTIEIK